MRFASWNVLNTNGDTARLQRFLAAVDADVVAFQELTPAHISALRDLGVGHLYLAQDFAERGETSFLGILTRTEAIAETALDHNPRRTISDSLLGRRMGWAECLQSQSVLLSTTEGILCVVNVHLSCAVSPRRRRSELLAMEQHLLGRDAVVICGDFNSFARPWLNVIAGWALGLGWSDLPMDERAEVSHFARRNGLGQAIPGSVTFPRFGLQLDHVLARGLRVASGHVCKETFGSDHRPVVAELRWDSADGATDAK